MILLIVFGLLSGVMGPVRQAYINENIPSAQRATVLSFDSFFSDVGAVGGQLGLGYAAQTVSKAAAYTIGGAIYIVAAPLYRRAGRATERLAALGLVPDELDVDELGGAARSPAEVIVGPAQGAAAMPGQPGAVPAEAQHPDSDPPTNEQEDA